MPPPLQRLLLGLCVTLAFAILFAFPADAQRFASKADYQTYIKTHHACMVTWATERGWEDHSSSVGRFILSFREPNSAYDISKTGSDRASWLERKPYVQYRPTDVFEDAKEEMTQFTTADGYRGVRKYGYAPVTRREDRDYVKIGQRESWEYYVREFGGVTMRGFSDTLNNQNGSDPKAMFEDYLRYAALCEEHGPEQALALLDQGTKLHRIFLVVQSHDSLKRHPVLVHAGHYRALPFGTARLYGRLEWVKAVSNSWHEGPLSGFKLAAHHVIDGKQSARIDVQTNWQGDFNFELPLAGSQSSETRSFGVFPRLAVRDGAAPPGPRWVIVNGKQWLDGHQPLPDLDDEIEVKQPVDWKVAAFNAASMYYALKKDIEETGAAGKNFEQWKRNHKVGRHSINALGMVIDIASGKATGHAQALDTGFQKFKQAMGLERLPFEKRITPEEARIMKQAAQTMWTYIRERDYSTSQ